MKHLAAYLIFAAAFSFAVKADDAENAPALSLSRLKEQGVYGFPQKSATVLCDQPELRFSVWNNDEYLFAQAVVWKDDDASLGKTDDNREIGDWSVLMLDLDADGKATPNVDRDYTLNPWPEMNGLYCQISMGERSSTGLKSDSHGRGAIRYINVAVGKQVRVDTFLIPLTEISRQVGDRIRLCYWGQSPKPMLTVNSAGYARDGKDYFSYRIPLSKYHNYNLTKGDEINFF